MKFSDIIGHRKEIARLVTMADSGKLPHALLFHGPSGIGKTMVARAFIQYLYCQSPSDGDSCGRCPSCLQTAKLNNPDVHFSYPIIKRNNNPLSIDFAEEWKEFLEENPYMQGEAWLEKLQAGNSQPTFYVSESNELIRLGSLSSYGDKYKVFVIWQPEKLSLSVANKLLKLIEEPFEDTVFIMVSNNPAAILPTIRSRLQAIEFCRLTDEEIAGFLTRNGKSEEESLSLARIARGNMNKASMLASTDGEIREFTELFIGVMRACYARKLTELKGFADKFAAYGREKSLRLLDYFARMVRESFISNLNSPILESMTPDEKSFVGKFGPFIHSANVEDMSREINRAKEDISRNANQKIVWFDFFLELTRLIRTRKP